MKLFKFEEIAKLIPKENHCFLSHWKLREYVLSSDEDGVYIPKEQVPFKYTFDN